MKKIFGLLMLAIPANSFSQSPYCYLVDSITYSPFPYSIGTAVSGMFDDSYSSVIPIGFHFCFFGGDYNSLIIGANGIISFNTSQAGGYCDWTIEGAIPSTTEPMNSIMVWQDLDPSFGGTIRFFTTGTPTNSVFVANYDSIPMYGCSKYFSGQILLYESSNIIETNILIKDTCLNWNSGLAIHGVHDPFGMEAHIVSGRNYPATWITSNDSWRFTPQCPPCGMPASLYYIPPNEIAIYPNPSNGIFTLQTEGKVEIEIFNVLGEKIYRQKVDPQKTEIDLSDELPGIYFVKIKSCEKSYSHRLIIQHE